MMEHYLSVARDQMGVPEDYPNQPLLEAYVYKNAAAESIPSLDLILTDSGFAVVSNQNLAPASRERVSALLNSLRRQASDARDLLLPPIELVCEFNGWDVQPAVPMIMLTTLDEHTDAKKVAVKG